MVILISGSVALARFFSEGPPGIAAHAPALTPEKQQTAFLVLAAFFVGTLLLTMVLFWVCTATARSITPARWLPAALAFQLLIALLFPDLLFVVACEAGYLLAGRGPAWMYGQAAFFLAFVLMSYSLGSIEVAPELMRSSPQLAIPLTVIQMFGWQMFAFAAGHLAGRELHARRSLSFANAQLQATQQVLADSTRMNERLTIARELHDTIGHHLAGLSLKLQLAAHHADGPAVKPVQDAHLIAKLLLSDVRATVSTMREEASVDLPRAIEMLCAGVERPVIHFEHEEAVPVPNASHAQALLRCAQEAITNAIKHSGATQMRIRLDSNLARVRLEIADNGKGASKLAAGNGLRGMRERLEAAGGSLAIETGAGKGFRLVAEIPHTGDPA